MKFTTTPVKAVKAFNFEAAEEALADSFERLNAAQEALLAVEGQCNKCLEVFEDCNTAIEAFNQFGDKSLNAVLAIFNGKAGTLDNALGLESLAADTIKTMSAAQSKVVKDKYVTALEANVGEAMKAFYEKCKEWLARFIEWIKELFGNNAKLIKLVQEAKFDKLDEEAQLTGITAENATKLVALLQAKLSVSFTGDVVSDSNVIDEGKGFVAKHVEDINALLERKTDTVKALGWSATKAESIAKEFAKIASRKELVDLSKTATDVLTKSISEAANGEEDKVNRLRNAKAYSEMARALIVAHSKGVRALGVQLLRMAKKNVKAEKPAEAAK